MPRLPPFAAAAAPLLLVVALTWPLALNLGDWHMVTAWGDSHVWILDWTFRHLARGEPGAVVAQTAEAGFPTPRDLRGLGGASLLIYAPLRLLLSPLAAGTLAHLLVFPLTGLVTYGALGRLTPADPWTRAAAATAYAVGPTVLSTLGMGEISNTQAWVLPAFLWVAAQVAPLEPERAPRWALAPLAALVGLLGGLSSPYYTLALPLLCLGWGLVSLKRRRVLAPLALGLCLGLGMVPVAAFYGGGAAGGTDSLVNPAPRSLKGEPTGQPLPGPPPVATPDSLVWPQPPATLSPYESTHVSYLGLPLLLGAAFLARRRSQGRGLGLALLVGGVILSLGPWLAIGGHYLSLAGRALPLPVLALEALHYPTRQGGLYFRYAVVAELGLVLLVAAGLAGRRHAPALAWALALLHAADSVRATMPRWPLRVEPVADLEILRAMAPPGSDGIAPDVMAADGAVLELPLQGPTDGLMGQASVLRALFHRRPTTGLLRDVQPHEHTARALLDAARRDPRGLGPALSEAGFRYVLLPRELSRFSRPDEKTLRRLLGEPWHDGELIVWKLW